MLDASPLRRAFRAFRPTPRERLAHWSIDNVVNDQQRPYDHAAYPHLANPGGPMDAFDDPRVRTIALQWGTRLGKTFFAQCALAFTADIAPAPMMTASSIEQLALEVISRVYAIMRNRPHLAAKLKKVEKHQRQDRIEFRNCLLRAAWSRSTSTLADKNIRVGHAGEYDKWEHPASSREAHPHKLFEDRFKDYQSVRKVIFEGTPTVTGESPIEARRLAGSDCRYEVPCPHCRRYQTLLMRGANGEYRIAWEKDEHGHSTPTIAYQTAHYLCAHCGGRCDDHHRPWMIRRGVWCPRGCAVDSTVAGQIAEANVAAGKPIHEWRGWKHAPWIRGTPDQDGQDASYQLSSLYALSLGWGDIGKEFVASRHKPQELRNFVNQWEGLTWQRRKARTTPEKIAERIGGKHPRGIVPPGGLFLTVSADRQAADGGFVVWTLLAHGAEERAWLVDHGMCLTLEELWLGVCRRHVPHADGGSPLVAAATIVDSGWNAKDTYDFCAAHPGCFPCKGANDDLDGAKYRFSAIGKKSRTGREGQTILWVATDLWEEDLQWRLENCLADEPRALTLSAAAARDPAFLAQLLNGTLGDALDARGQVKLLWKKKDANEANDFRDAIRYGLCLGRAYVDEVGLPARSVGQEKPRSAVISAGESRPDGRSWLER